jgi:hypothetical protein
MRLVEARFHRVRTTMPNPWSLVRSAEEFCGDFSTHGRLLLKGLREDTMGLCRDEWVRVEWHLPADRRKTYRNGYHPGRLKTASALVPRSVAMSARVS